MSMICSVLGLSPSQIKAVRATPSLASDVAMVAVLDEMTKTMPPEKRQAFQQHESELRAEVAQYFPLLRDYVGRMAAKKCGLLIWLV